MHSTVLVVSDGAHSDPYEAVAREIEAFVLPFEAAMRGDVLTGWWDELEDIGLPVDYWRVETRIAFGSEGAIPLRGADGASLRRLFEDRYRFAAVIVGGTFHGAAEFGAPWAHLPVRVGNAGEGGMVVAWNESDADWDSRLYDRFVKRLSARHLLIAVDIHY